MMVPIAAVVMSLSAKSSMQETRVELGRLGKEVNMYYCLHC